MLPPSSDFRSTRAIHEEQDLARYMPIVHQTVAALMRRLPCNVQRDDLVAAGTWGLMDSLRRTPTAEGTAFESYVRIRIRGAMVDELRAQDWLPRRVRRAVNRRESGDSALVTSVVGLEDVTAGDPMALADTQNRSPMDEVLASSERKLVAAAVNKLPARERTVVELHYFSGVRFKLIGNMLGVSEPRISQLHSRALQRLRDMLSCELEAA
ncbi:MAG: sigma-70 family RNA polymerase sigma factor [Deltaproteobacteria bacterium]|nr:sigma-70 family RNA polymerase sigma factor [Deltaproteobacteria bacterium]